MLPIAAMFHPLALCYLPGLLLLALHVWRGGRRRLVVAAFGLGLFCSIPEMIHVALVFMQDSYGGDALGFYSFQSYSSAWIVTTAAEAFATLQPFPAGAILLAGPFVVLGWCAFGGGTGGVQGKRNGVILFALWAVLSAVGLLALVLLLGNHRGYHWRIPLPNLALALGVAVYLPALAFLSRLRRSGAVTRWAVAGAVVVAASLSIFSASLVVSRIDRFPSGTGDLTSHRWMAELIQEDAGTSKRWYETVLLGWEMRTISAVFMPSVYVEHRMMGVPREAIQGDGLLYLAVTGPVGLVDDLRMDMGWDDTALEHWDRATPAGGASGVAVPGAFPTDVHLIGHHRLSDELSMALVRLPDSVATRAWTAWLHQRFTGAETPRLMLDSNFALSLTMPGAPYSDWCCWFDPGLMREFPGVFSSMRGELEEAGTCDSPRTVRGSPRSPAPPR